MMHEYIDTLKGWAEKNAGIAIARVIKTWGSSPRPVGSVMLINAEGKIAGSVSGGCVEGSVVKSARMAIEDGMAKKLAFGVSDADAWSVGLSCGGRIQVFVESADFHAEGVWKALLENIEQDKSCTLITSLEEGNNLHALIREDGTITGDQLPETIIRAAREAYRQRSHRTVEEGDRPWFIQVFPRKPELLIIGAAHITVDLVSLGNMFGFETIVIDPRGFFAGNMVFHDPPTKIIEAYPSEVLDAFVLDAYTFCAILSHDPKIDDNALEILLPSEVGYIGALGSRKTHRKRTARLLDKGIAQDLIDRIHAPIGEDINARTAREIALSIMSEIIRIKNQYV